MITLDKMNNSYYWVCQETQYIGNFVMDVDGFFYYSPSKKLDGLWSEHSMREVADKLKELNKDWEEQIDRQMKKDQRDEFVCNAICRSTSHRQKIADKMLEEISKTMQPEKAWLVRTEWNHYLMGEMTPDQFAKLISNLLQDEVEQ